jgi:hypothetical protein
VPGRTYIAEIMMWASAIGVFSVAAVVNQRVIALFRRRRLTHRTPIFTRAVPELRSGR